MTDGVRCRFEFRVMGPTSLVRPKTPASVGARANSRPIIAPHSSVIFLSSIPKQSKTGRRNRRKIGVEMTRMSCLRLQHRANGWGHSMPLQMLQHMCVTNNALHLPAAAHNCRGATKMTNKHLCPTSQPRLACHLLCCHWLLASFF